MPPWEKYQSAPSGPWAKYQEQPTATAPAQEPQGFLSKADNFIRQEGLPIAGGILGGMAGFASPPGNIPGAIAGATAGGMAGRGIQRALNAYQNPNVQVNPLEVAGDVATSGLSQGAGEAFGHGTMNVLGRIGQRILPGAQKAGAQFMRVQAGIPEREGLAVLKDPAMFDRMLPKQEAGQLFEAATPGLKSGADAQRAAFGKSYLSPERAADEFDNIAADLAAGKIDPQKAFSLRQATMEAISDIPHNQGKLKRLLAQNIEALDDFLEPIVPGWKGARQAYRESNIGEQFSSLYPLNKNQSPNALRSVLATKEAMYTAAAGVAAAASGGNPWALGAAAVAPLALASISPLAYKGLIKTTVAGAKLIPGAVISGSHAAAGGLDEIYRNMTKK